MTLQEREDLIISKFNELTRLKAAAEAAWDNEQVSARVQLARLRLILHQSEQLICEIEELGKGLPANSKILARC